MDMENDIIQADHIQFRFFCTDIFFNETIIWDFVGCWSRRSLILCLCGQGSTSPCFLHSQVQEASNRTVNVQAQKFCDGFVLWDLVTTSWSVCFWLSHTFTGWWGIVVIWCHSQDLKECHTLISLAALHMLINKDHAVIWIASLLNTFEPGARVATSIGPKKKFLLPQKSFGVWTILINLYKLQQLDRCLWWSAKTSEPSCCPMFHVQSSSMSCRSKARGAKPLGVIKKDFSGKSQKVIFWKTSHKRSNGLLFARKVKRYVTFWKKTQQKNQRVALPGCDSWSSTLQPEEHRWAVSLFEECGGPEFTGNSITHATWLHGFQAYVIAHAKYLFGSRKLLGSITIISNRCFSPWSVLNHLGKVHFDPFWSFCVFPPNCVFVFATVSGTHTCIQYLTLLVWSSLEDGNVQEAPEITSFLPELRLPKGLDKGCPKCNVMYTPSSNFCQQYLGWLTRATRFGNVKFCQCALHRLTP